MKQMIEKHDSDLDRWLGRREAFALIAGRCSAAEVESLRRIRDEKLYRGRARTWEEFCSQHLGMSRRNVDRNLRYLEEFGPSYFHLSQLMHVTPEEYRAIAPQVGEDGVRLDGNVIALLPENSDKVAAAVGELLKSHRPKAERNETDNFEIVFNRCQAANDALDRFP